MRIVFCFSEQGAGNLKYLKETIKKATQGCEVRRCHTTRDLSVKLKNIRERFDLAILVATNRQELEAYLSSKALLENIRIVLIIPDYEHETINMGHKLRPRFMTHIGSDPSMVEAVLKKMVAQKNYGLDHQKFTTPHEEKHDG